MGKQRRFVRDLIERAVVSQAGALELPSALPRALWELHCRVRGLPPRRIADPALSAMLERQDR